MGDQLTRVKNNERLLQALELRKQGYTLVEIGKTLNWGSHQTVSKAISRALKLTLQEPTQEIRQIELERLDAILKAISPRIEAGSLPHIDRALRVMERRARLLGLDSPARVDVSTLGEPIRLIEVVKSYDLPSTEDKDDA